MRIVTRGASDPWRSFTSAPHVVALRLGTAAPAIRGCVFISDVRIFPTDQGMARI
jgi:hypothetical protein